MLVHAARDWPDDVALIDTAGSMTYAELLAEAEQLRDALIARGAGPGRGVGLLAKNSRHFVVALFAGVATGATVLPISHQAKRAEVDELLRACPLHGILDDRSGVEPVLGAAEDLPDAPLRWTPHAQGPVALAPHVPEAAFMRFTSGTTGNAKGVIVGHRSVLERTAAAIRSLSLSPRRHGRLGVAHGLPLHRVHRHLRARRRAHRHLPRPPGRHHPRADRSPPRHRPLCVAVPLSHARRRPQHGRTRPDSASPSARPAGSRKTSSTRSTPGSMSTCPQVLGIIEIGLPAGNLHEGRTHPNSIGRAFPDYEIELWDDDDRPVAQGTPGRLAIPGARHVRRLPRSSGHARRDHPRRLVPHPAISACRTRKDASPLSGRATGVINAAGLKVFPEEVEAVLLAHPAVKACRVAGIPHRLMGEAVAAEVVFVPGGEVAPAVLRSHCRGRLSTYKVPQHIVAIDEIAMTPTGKIARTAPFAPAQAKTPA